jgi:hypothetical protein
MSKKMMLLALAAVSAAMFAMPAVASATPNHISATTAFTVHGPAGALNTTTESTKTVTCTTMTGSGAFTTTTGGTLSLTWHGCQTLVFGFPVSCTSTSPAGGSSGTITTTPLTFDLITTDKKEAGVEPNGILVTPPAGGQFAHFECAGVQTTVEGPGIIGTITKPCVDPNPTNKAVLHFNPVSAHGEQEHRLYTGNAYHLKSNGETAAMNQTADITFTSGARSLVCT